MACKMTSSLSNACADLLKGSGLAKKVWIGYLSDLDTRFSLAQSADISTIDFGGYGALYAIEGTKFAHDFTWALNVGAGSSKSYTHALNIKALPGSTLEDVQIQNLLLGDDIFAIVEDVNRQFFLLGPNQGMSATEATGGSGGKETGGDISDIITLTSAAEITKPLRFALGSGYDATLAYLVARQA